MNWIDQLNSALEKALSFTHKHLKFFLFLIVAMVAVGAAVSGLGHQKASREAAAFADLAPLEKSFSNWKTPATDAKSADKVDPQDLYQKLTQFIEKKGDLGASQMAALMASELASSLTKESELLSLLQKTFSNSGDSLLTGLALMKQGDLWVNADQCEKALSLWNQVTSSKHWPYLKDMAHLKSGLCYEKMTKNDQAKSQYELVIKAQNAKPDAWAYREAQKYLRSLEWTQK